MYENLKQSFLNSQSLHQELAWFEKLLLERARLHKEHSPENPLNILQKDFLLSHPPPTSNADTSAFALLCQKMLKESANFFAQPDLNTIHCAERVVLILSLCPHVRPQLLDIFFFPNRQNRAFTEFGGWRGEQHKGFLPTGETALYILAGDNLELRFFFQSIFTKEHYFHRENIIRIDTPSEGEPFLSGPLKISTEYLQKLTTAKAYQPEYSIRFPARKLNTLLTWDDLVLDYETYIEVEEVKSWIKYRHQLLQDPDFNREITGYRCLFYGEPGTGKTLTTSLLGQEVGLDVYRIDLSKIISKYIGETEKNLSYVFEQAEYQNWILFFDEGDSLFGKRTQAKSANDRYANQEISYLLQKIEEHPGIIILATNVRSNMDKAFLRRFQSEVYFPIPQEETRLRLWRKAMQNRFQLDEKINLEEIARKYEITGAAIKNIKHTCAIMTLAEKADTVSYHNFKAALRKELDKEGKKL